MTNKELRALVGRRGELRTDLEPETFVVECVEVQRRYYANNESLDVVVHVVSEQTGKTDAVSLSYWKTFYRAVS